MTENGSIAIRAEHVSRHYQMGSALIRAVDDVSLEIQRGEFLALLGSSGSGKSTLLNLLAGPRPADFREHHRAERNLSEISSLELARYRSRTVGMVFQAFNLLPRMTLEENVELPLRLAELDRSERGARVREALERVHLEKRSTHRPSQLSGGEQQRAALARALVNRPPILLADEPTGNLDSATGQEIMKLLDEIVKSLGATIILVTHERPLAEQYRQPHRFPGRRKNGERRGEAMKAGDLTEMALRNLREAVLRNSLTTLGVAVGVASLVAMLSLGVGLQQLATRRLSHSGLFDTVLVTSRANLRGFGPGAAAPRADAAPPAALDEDARHSFERLPGVMEVYPQIRFMTEVRFENNPFPGMVAGIPDSARGNGAFDGIQGNFFLERQCG